MYFLRGGLKVLVETASGKTMTFEMNKCDTIRKLKSKIHALEGATREEQTLIFDGKELLDDWTLEMCDIEDKSTILVRYDFPDVQRMAGFARTQRITEQRVAAEETVSRSEGLVMQLNDEPLLDCFGDTQTCLLCYFCPCVVVARTAHFAGWSQWVGAVWCFAPPCVGAALRQQISLRIGEDPHSCLVDLVFYHCICLPCSICQEARVAKSAHMKGVG